MNGPSHLVRKLLFKSGATGVCLGALLYNRKFSKEISDGREEDSEYDKIEDESDQPSARRYRIIDRACTQARMFLWKIQKSFFNQTSPLAEEKWVRAKIVDLPARKDIFRHYLSKLPIAADVDIEKLAQQTENFGDDTIEYAVNIAALRSAMDGKKEVNMEYLEQSIHFVVCKRARRYLMAYHEAGHAVVAHCTPHARRIDKVTIATRGSYSGQISYKRSPAIRRKEVHYLADIDVNMAGYVATKKAFKPFNVTMDIAYDLRRARKAAASLIALRAGAREPNDKEVYGAMLTAEQIRAEIDRLLEESYQRVKAILDAHAEAHTRVTEALLYKSTVDGDEVRIIVHSI